MKTTTVLMLGVATIVTLTVSVHLRAQVNPSAQNMQGMQGMQLGNLKMAAPEVRPGDAALSCKQIAAEIGAIMKTKKLPPAPNKPLTCAQKKSMMGPAMANMGPMMQMMNDGRLVQLGQLAGAKNCAAEGPPPGEDATPDPCATGAKPQSPSNDPFVKPAPPKKK